jgi:hypothetical protein
MDVFSLLITFLLMSFSADPVSHDVNQAVELPDSKTSVSLDEVPSITVTKTDIIVNDKKIVQLLPDSEIPEKDKTQGAIYPLYLELQKQAEANKRAAALEVVSATGKPKPGTIAMEFHKEHKFKLMKRIMLTGQQADFVTFKLEVAKEGS